MNIKRKIEIAAQAIDSITRHDDAEQDVVLRALEIVRAHMDLEIKTLRDRRAQKIEAAQAALAETT